MKVAILGTEDLSKSLAKALSKHGYHVMIGAKTLGEADEIAGPLGHYAQGATYANAIHYGEVVILTMPYKEVETVLRNVETYRGKLIVDATTPLVTTKMVGLAFGHSTSAAEQIAKMVPGATGVVKAFSTAFPETIESPFYGPNELSVFYCGDDEAGKKVVAKMISDMGMDGVDCGPLTGARFLEPMTAMLVRLGVSLENGHEIGFKLLRRN